MASLVPENDLPEGTNLKVERVVPSHDLPGASSGPEDNSPGFPFDKPGMEYGSVLPFARDTKTGETSLAAPEMIRAPLRGAAQWGADLLGAGRKAGAPEAKAPTQDELAATMSMGGAKPVTGPSVGVNIPPRFVPQHVAETRSAGYVLPPAMTGKPGPLTAALSGWGGKIKLQQSASVKNQEVTNGLAAEALGLPKSTVLNEKVLQKVREDAGKAYGDVENSVPYIFPDDQFGARIRAIGGSNSQAAQYFPKLMSNPGIKALTDEMAHTQYFSPRAGLEVVKELRFQGNSNLKAPGDPMKHALGLAQRQAADEIDNLMERNISVTAPDLIPAYRAARQQIAKSYDIEGAMNPATGDVNALGLGKLAVKGRPLTGELDTVAKAANAFPRAMQNVSRFGGDEAHSAVDFFGSALAIGHGNPAVAATILGRPVARGIVLGNRMQNRLATPGPRDRMLPTQAEIAPLLMPGAMIGGDNENAR